MWDGPLGGWLLWSESGITLMGYFIRYPVPGTQYAYPVPTTRTQYSTQYVYPVPSTRTQYPVPFIFQGTRDLQPFAK